MLHVSLDPYRLIFRESVGLAHETQVIEIPGLPPITIPLLAPPPPAQPPP